MIRVLIADDSATFRAVISSLLSRTPGVVVIGEARDGTETVEKTILLRPDVITMDIQMPRLDGIAAIREIMARAPTPIVIVCAGASAQHQQSAFRGLKAGALEVLEK